MASQTDQFIMPPLAKKILVWHQGALGDILLAGPALQAVSAHFHGSRLTLVGGPEQLHLLTDTLPVEAVWHAQRAMWLDLFQDCGNIDARLSSLLSQFDLALVFTPRRQAGFLHRLRLAGIYNLFWLPSFPVQIRMPVGQVQREILQNAGFKMPQESFKLNISDYDHQTASSWMREQYHPGTPLVALAPGSGHPLKNWPLDSYAELARSLEEQHQTQVWWIIGPAETGLLCELQKMFPGRDLRLLKNLPLRLLAATLSVFDLFVGNDCGVTHLAAILAQPQVVALFGPSDPVIWAPLRERATIITSGLTCAPCTQGREIHCPDNICLSAISPEEVITAIGKFF